MDDKPIKLFLTRGSATAEGRVIFCVHPEGNSKHVLDHITLPEWLVCDEDVVQIKIEPASLWQKMRIKAEQRLRESLQPAT